LSFAFPRAARLRSPREFERVLSGGRRLQENSLTAALRSNDLSHARLGFAISARSVPAATDRNRIKRQTRESFRLHRAQLPPLDIVLLARAGAGSMGNPDLRATLERLWQKMASVTAP
jgi:ribonuclease P protein component